MVRYLVLKRIRFKRLWADRGFRYGYAPQGNVSIPRRSAEFSVET